MRRFARTAVAALAAELICVSAWAGMLAPRDSGTLHRAASVAVDEHGFGHIPLGPAVSDWFPVDLDSDGTWEFAITAVGTPTRVGVFAPGITGWLDGPRELLVTGDQWGVGDWNGDGTLEYAYRSGRSMRLLDTRTEVDTALWSTDFDPQAVVVWGRDSAGNPLVGWRKDLTTFTEWYDCPTCYPGTRRYFQYEWRVYDLMSGVQIAVVPAGLGTIMRLPALQERGTERLFVYESHGYFEYNGGTYEYAYQSQSFRVVDQHWNVLVAAQLPDRAKSFMMGLSLWGLAHAAFIPAQFGAGGEKVVWYSVSMLPGLDAGEYLGLHSLTDSTGWSKFFPECFWCPAGDSLYAGVAAYDLSDDGSPELILSFSDSSGWQIRDLDDGSIQDTMPNMPRADLQTAPLFVTGHRELFYLADSTLYVHVSDTYTAAGEEDGNPVPAADLALHAVPNPFNSAVRLSWSDAVEPSRLEILNILGQRVRVFDLSVIGSVPGVVWDGTDASGRPVPSGVYFGRLVARDRSATVKIILLK